MSSAPCTLPRRNADRNRAFANPDGNAYDHATAARLAGASLLNTDNGRAKAYLQQAIDFNGLNNNDQFESMRLASFLSSQSSASKSRTSAAI